VICAIRADASIAIGSGHVMRCLTLAEFLRDRGAEVYFICRITPGDCREIILAKGFQVFPVSAGLSKPVEDAMETADHLSRIGADWLVVDHYGLDRNWEQQQRAFVGRIMVIDDLADRAHDCDLLLDQNMIAGMTNRYAGLVPERCRLFLGPSYVLLREEFVAARSNLKRSYGAVRRMLVFYGGSDPTNETEKALEAIRSLKFTDIVVDLVIGGANPHAASINSGITDMPQVVAHTQVNNMAALMASSDLALGAGGTTTWERCFLGLPTLLTIVADNQASPAKAVATAGMARLLGTSASVSHLSLADAIISAINRPDELESMSKRCLNYFYERNSSVAAEIGAILSEGCHAA